MKSKKWSISVFVGSFILILLNTLFLVMVDTHAIVNPKAELVYTVPNQRYAVVEYLLANKDKYDTFIFGSSKVGAINPKLFKNKKAYNLTVGAGIPHEHLLLLKLLLKNNIDIKHIYIGLDDFSPHVTFEQHDSSFNLKSHYLTTGISKIDFYSFYFMRIIKNADIKHFKNKYFSKDFQEQQFLKNVQNTVFNQSAVFEKITETNNTTSIDSNNSIYNQPTIISTSYNNINNTIEDIQNIINICKENNITYNIAINPVHKTTYNAINLDNFIEFKEKLSYVTSYYDFSQPSLVNSDNNYWKETSHFNVEVGDMMIDKIYNSNSTIKDFGIYVSKQTKELH